tara:strand:- start:9 stop:422 length:414 start_codon:yes stop_codon:yes gene_type:complete
MATKNFVPRATGEGQLGTNDKKWKNSFFSGTGSFGHIIVDGNITASGEIRADSFQSVAGGNTIDFADSINVTGNLTASGDLKLDDIIATGNISGSFTTTGSFGRVETAGDINSDGRIYENNTSVIDHATAMAIVFGG